jgi:quercetin dioxygenase-like cupin family protein
MTEDEAKVVLKREGYNNIYTWFDSPDEEYPMHAHPNVRKHIVVQGDMTVEINNEKKDYQAGDEFTVEANTSHAAVMGPEGCTYVVGEL